MIEHVVVEKVSNIYVQVHADDGIIREMSEFFTFSTPGYQFSPAFRNKYWDGKIRLLNTNTKQIYVGLVPYIKKFCKDSNYGFEYLDEENKQVIPCDNEEQLLRLFLDLWESVDPTIITGWNSGFFDVPYLYYRLCNVVGRDEAARLSPIRKFKFTEWDQSQPIEIAGINHLDYLLLYKKYNPKNEPSYKLGDIGTKYVNLGKIDYEGNLDRLFKEDVNKYIEYNIRDVEIIIELEKKFKFIELTVAICHLCHVPYEMIYLSTVLNDGAILTYLKRNNIVSPNKPTTTNPALKEAHEEYAGGYLKDPVPGLYEWVIDLDFTSLYPSIIRSLSCNSLV